MNSLFQLAANNPALEYIDDTTDLVVKLNDLPKINFSSNSKSLAFAYLDNSIKSIAVFWSLMQSKHCVALLPPSMANDLKFDLEILYNPEWIIDFSRDQINGFQVVEENGLKYFTNFRKINFNIHDDIKLLLNTSGTTGSPKFVKLSEQNIISNAQSITQYLPITHNDVTPLNLPIYYSYGLSVLTSNSIGGGKIICTNDDVLKKSFWENLNKYQYTSFAGVPFVYEMLDRIGFTKKNYPSLKYLTQAGGKLQEHLIRKYATYCNSKNMLFFVMYGQTEATARMSFLEPNCLLDKIGSIGKPIPGGNFTIENETGELCYEGENVFGGYVNNPDDLLIYNQPEKLKTGDLAIADKDGFYYITGRLKRFVKLFGTRINLDEIETLVAKHKHTIVKCIGLNDKLLIVFYDNESIAIDEIIKFISEELKLHISVIKKHFIESFPLTDNGKVNYKELLKLYDTE